MSEGQFHPPESRLPDLGSLLPCAQTLPRPEYAWGPGALPAAGRGQLQESRSAIHGLLAPYAQNGPLPSRGPSPHLDPCGGALSRAPFLPMHPQPLLALLFSRWARGGEPCVDLCIPNRARVWRLPLVGGGPAMQGTQVTPVSPAAVPRHGHPAQECI